jgi:hypothetical protein
MSNARVWGLKGRPFGASLALVYTLKMVTPKRPKQAPEPAAFTMDDIARTFLTTPPIPHKAPEKTKPTKPKK